MWMRVRWKRVEGSRNGRVVDLGFVLRGSVIDWTWGFREREVWQGLPITHLINWMKVGVIYWAGVGAVLDMFILRYW